MTERECREYHAIIWTKDPKEPGRRVSVLATSLEEAKSDLEAEYGVGTVYYLRNLEDADRPR